MTLEQRQEEKRIHRLSILVQDVPGVLSQVARLFSQKGYNIESIVSGKSREPDVTRITITILATRHDAEQITAQCYKLYPVLTVKILDEAASVARELILVKVRAVERGIRDEVIQMSNIFRADIIDVSRETLTVAVLGSEGKTAAFLNLMSGFEILEIACTGTLAMDRGSRTIHDGDKLQTEYDLGKSSS